MNKAINQIQFTDCKKMVRPPQLISFITFVSDFKNFKVLASDQSLAKAAISPVFAHAINHTNILKWEFEARMAHAYH